MSNLLLFLLKKSLEIFLRFPITLLWAFIVFIIFLTGNEFSVPLRIYLIEVTILSFLAIPLTFAIQMWIEKNKYSAKVRWTTYVLANLLLAIYFFSVYDNKGDFVVLYRHVLLVLAAHLLVSFIPYLSSGSSNDFWQYNKRLFLAFVKAVALSVILYYGVRLVFVCLAGLFDLNIPTFIEKKIFFLFFFVLNTYFFLANIPKNMTELASDTSDTWSLKALVQYILLPLMIGYLTILYIYTISIILGWNWSKGNLFYFGLGISIAGILAFLFFYPLTLMRKNRWSSQFKKGYFLLLGLLVLLPNLVLWWQIAARGINAKRYFLVILVVWFALISIYFIVNKEKNIKFLPISLFVLILFSTLSSFNAFNVSAQSQANQLKHIFEQKKVFVDGKFNKDFEKFSKKEFQTMQKRIIYLSEQHHRIDLLQPLFGKKWDVILEGESHPYPVRRKLQRFLFDNISPIMNGGPQW